MIGKHRTRLLCTFLAAWSALCAYSQTSPPDLTNLNDSLIQAEGSPEIYFLDLGSKHYVQPEWIKKNLAGQPVHVLKPEELSVIPSGYPLSLGAPVPRSQDAKAGIMRVGPDGKLYVVEDNEMRWVRDYRWIAESKYAGQLAVPATQAELDRFQLGADIPYMPLRRKIKLASLMVALLLFLSVTGSEPLKNALSARLAFLPQIPKWYGQAVLTLMFAVAIAVREPYLLSHPRFWAEEGFPMFQYAASHSVIKSLLIVYPSCSYLYLAGNIGAILAAGVASTWGLEHAPVATTCFAFLIQILAIALILFCKSSLFTSVWKAVAGGLIVLFAATTQDELWLNTTNAMTFLGLITLVLLFAKTEDWSGTIRWGARGLLLLCGLSSPYSVAVLPLFLILAWRSKEREKKVQCLLLALCLVVQTGEVVHTRINFTHETASRTLGVKLRWDALATIVFSEHMVLPALGESSRDLFLSDMGLKDAWLSESSFAVHPIATSARAGGWLCLVLMFGMLWWLRQRDELFSTQNMLIGAFLLLAAFTSATAMSGIPTNRYAFLSGIVFLLLLLLNIEDSSSWPRRSVCMVVLAYGLATGILAYRTPKFQGGPSWSREVQLWQTDPSHQLRVWPSYFYPEAGITYAKQSTK